MHSPWQLRQDQTLETASACLKARRFAAAALALDAASPAVARSPQWALLRGLADTRLGRIDSACALLLPLARGAEPLATEAALALAEAYHFAQRHEELAALLALGQPWVRSLRGALVAARVCARSDPEQALALLHEVVESKADDTVRRVAGFDAVRLLDRHARYRQAYELAQRLHASTTPAFALGEFLASVQLQVRLLAKGAQWCAARCPPVQGTAFVVGLPRSGTTLLEQMLDSHPGIAAIGEHEGVGDAQRALVEAGVWPYRINHLAAPAAGAMQAQYLSGARQRAANGKAWTLDKSLLTWRCLPAVAALLPGAVCVRIQRDPRDMAISAMLSYFDPLAFGWTASLNSIRQVVQAERELVPLALRALGIAHESVVYEELVAQPAPVMQRVLDCMGLPMDERVLAPQDNRRTAITLSHAQVQEPINDSSIGRWQHYDFAFDADWNA
jgi:hypothetical protein